MKRTNIAIICCLILLFLSTGCATDPLTFYFDSKELKENVIKVELIEYTNDNPKIIIVNDNSTPRFDFNSTRLIKKLPSDKISSFIDDLSNITFHKENKSVDEPIGRAVLIYSKNYEIIVLSCTVLNGFGYSMVAKFSTNGDFIENIAIFADEPRYRRLLEIYFTV